MPSNASRTPYSWRVGALLSFNEHYFGKCCTQTEGSSPKKHRFPVYTKTIKQSFREIFRLEDRSFPQSSVLRDLKNLFRKWRKGQTGIEKATFAKQNWKKWKKKGLTRRCRCEFGGGTSTRGVWHDPPLWRWCVSGFRSQNSLLPNFSLPPLFSVTYKIKCLLRCAACLAEV